MDFEEEINKVLAVIPRLCCFFCFYYLPIRMTSVATWKNNIEIIHVLMMELLVELGRGLHFFSLLQ